MDQARLRVPGAGEQFQVSLYASGVTNLIGYEVKVAFDKDKVALQSLLEQTSVEGANLLKLMVIFIFIKFR